MIRANLNEVEPAIQTRLGTVWFCRTADSLRAILTPGYFDAVLSHGIRVNDRIEVVSLAAAPAEHATLAVDEIRYAEPGEPRCIVRALAQTEREKNDNGSLHYG